MNYLFDILYHPLLLSLFSLLLAAAVLLWDRLRLRRVFSRMDDMLDRAIQGDFQEEIFDESRLSAVESKLSRYLSAAGANARSLQQEKEAIESLIADISHQTKTPIANVLLYAQLLAEQPLPPDGRDCLASLESQAERLRSLIDALVKTSRLETNVIRLSPTPAKNKTSLPEYKIGRGSFILCLIKACLV